jgi:hypothetical protein
VLQASLAHEGVFDARRAGDAGRWAARATQELRPISAMEEMLNPKYHRYVNRLRDLIKEGQSVAKLERPSSVGPYIQGEDKTQVQGWLTKVRNILDTVFGTQSIHVRQFEEVLPKGGVRLVEHSRDVHAIVGVLTGALDDLEQGYLLGQEFLIAGEVFDSCSSKAARPKWL